MRATTHASRDAALLEIARIDAARGYPITEQGTRVGGGRHVATITTTTDQEPVELKDGTWAVDADRAEAAGVAPGRTPRTIDDGERATRDVVVAADEKERVR